VVDPSYSLHSINRWSRERRRGRVPRAGPVRR